MFRIAPLLCAGLFLGGCATAPTKQTGVSFPEKPAAVSLPSLEKTFGDVSVGKSNFLTIHYKDISVLIDPVMDAGQTADLSPRIDYVFLTDAGPSHFGDAARRGLRRDIKLVASSGEADKLKKENFTAVKSLVPGQRIMLKKNDNFLFASVVQTRNKTSDLLVNGYLLEFDNGRNIFIAGDTVDMSAMRTFLYDLRDDGKEIQLAFVRLLDDEAAVQTIALLQPQIAITSADAQWTSAERRQRLQDEMFSGGVYPASEGASLSF